MADEQEDVPKPRVETRKRCPTCAAFPGLTASMLDITTGRTVRLYTCGACGERVWDD